jgi:Protein of unknown function (DUF4230)
MTANLLKNPYTLNKALGGVIAILVVLLLWLSLQFIHRGAVDVVRSGTVVLRVRDMSELTTAMFQMETVVPVSEKGLLPTIESKLLYIAHGNVRVGVNLDEFQDKNVEITEKEITITLPPLKILDSKLDLEHSSVYSYDRGFLGWGPDVVNLQAQAQREALQKIENAACQGWVIKQASDRVEKTVDNLLSHVFKDEAYKITVKAQLPAEGSCGIAK